MVEGLAVKGMVSFCASLLGKTMAEQLKEKKSIDKLYYQKVKEVSFKVHNFYRRKHIFYFS